MHRTPRARRFQRGNILFLILLAVALFAALNYAVTSSMQGGGKDASSENAEAAAAELLNFATLLESTINRLRLTNGCQLSQLNFDNLFAPGYDNNFAPTDGRCDIFSSNGGGISWKEIDPTWLVDLATAQSYQNFYTDYGLLNIPSTVCIPNIGTDPACGSSLASNKHLILGLRYLSKELCDAINAKFGYETNTPPAACSPAGDFAGKYTGTFYSAGTYRCPPHANGKRTACINSSRTGYTFYHVLALQ